MSRRAESPTRRVWARLTIAQGNALQAGGLLLGLGMTSLAASGIAPAARSAAMLSGWLSLYFCCHASAHWATGRVLGIRFSHYTVSGSAAAAAYPAGMREVFSRMPFFAVHVVPADLRLAPRLARFCMFGAGMSSSAVFGIAQPAWCATSGVPGAEALLIFAVAWFAAAIVGEFRHHGDFARAFDSLRR